MCTVAHTAFILFTYLFHISLLLLFYFSFLFFYLYPLLHKSTTILSLRNGLRPDDDDDSDDSDVSDVSDYDNYDDMKA